MSKRFSDVEFLAQLARLDLSSAEAKNFRQQIPAILDYVGQLGKVVVDRSVITPLSPQPMRPDEVSISRAIARILEEAPERQDRYWKVKAVF